MTDTRSKLQSIAADPEALVTDPNSVAQAILLLSQTIAAAVIFQDEEEGRHA